MNILKKISYLLNLFYSEGNVHLQILLDPSTDTRIGIVSFQDEKDKRSLFTNIYHPLCVFIAYVLSSKYRNLFMTLRVKRYFSRYSNLSAEFKTLKDEIVLLYDDMKAIKKMNSIHVDALSYFDFNRGVNEIK